MKTFGVNWMEVDVSLQIANEDFRMRSALSLVTTRLYAKSGEG